MSGEYEVFVPGRVCLFGEHTDWSGQFRKFNSELEKGYTIVCGTNQGLYARVKKHPSLLVLSSTDEKGVKSEKKILMERGELYREAQSGSMWAYICGVAYKILVDYRVEGLVLDNYKTDLPLKKGLSSSAAICVLVARAFSRVYDLKMTIRGEMEYAYQGEIVTPSRCGRMDQACAYGNRPVIMTYDSEFLEVEELRVSVPLYYVIVDLRAEKDTVVILRELQSAFPTAKSQAEKDVQNLLGAFNQSIAERSVEALKAGNIELLGKLMTEANKEFYRVGGAICPSQLTAPMLHKCLEHPSLQPYILGGKGVGAGGDGTAQFLCRSAEDQEKVCRIVAKELKGTPVNGVAPPMEPLKLTIKPACKVQCAVVTAAGFNPALFPAMKAVKPELFPVIIDGVAMPAMFHTVEQIIDSGIEKVYILIQPEDQQQFENLFHKKISSQNEHRLDDRKKAYVKKIQSMGEKIHFIKQETQDGFGHAIALCKEALQQDFPAQPFLLVLGHHVYRTMAAKTCVQQLVEAYGISGKSVMGLKTSPLSEVSKFGTVTGVWLDDSKQRLSINQVEEKPSAAYAQKNLVTKGLEKDTFLTAFGMYCVEATIFDHLDELIINKKRTHGLYQFTDALESMRKASGLDGLHVDGERYNIGNPAGYLGTLNALNVSSPALNVSSGDVEEEEATSTGARSYIAVAACAFGLGALIATLLRK